MPRGTHGPGKAGAASEFHLNQRREGRNMRRKISFGLLVVLIAVSLLAVACKPKEAALGTKDNPIVLAFVPSAEAQRVIDSAEDFTSLLSEKTGYVFEG
jgi:ABC-type phosphate/phosphonate transport system substrate-binding protein